MWKCGLVIVFQNSHDIYDLAIQGVYKTSKPVLGFGLTYLEHILYNYFDVDSFFQNYILVH